MYYNLLLSDIIEDVSVSHKRANVVTVKKKRSKLIFMSKHRGISL